MRGHGRVGAVLVAASERRYRNMAQRRIGIGKSACGIPEGEGTLPSGRGSRLYGQSPDPESFILDDNDGPGCEFRRALGDHSKESWTHGGRSLVSQPKDDDARSFAARGRENVSEIQIEGKHNSALRHGFRRDPGVGETDEPFVAEVDRFVIRPIMGPQTRILFS